MRPAAPKLYHILHRDKLPHVIRDGALFSDEIMRQAGERGTAVGMSTIKQRRLSLEVECQKGLMVGACVPFYYCPRSVMLYLLYRGNHPDLAYRGGQAPIVHLEFDLHTVAQWAQANGLRWAITLSNAGSSFFESRSETSGLEELNWDAIAERDFRPREIKEAKQAEFLVERQVPWELVEKIGVLNRSEQTKVAQTISVAAHRPPVVAQPDWYY